MSSRTPTLDRPADAPPSRGRRRAWIAAAVVAALVVSGGLWWVTHAAREFRVGYGIAVEKAVDKTTWTVLEHGRTADPGEIVITAIEPVFSEGGDDVEIEYVVCDLDPATLEAQRVGGFGYGLGDRAVERYCREPTPAEGATWMLGTTPGVELLVGVTATSPSRTVIDHFRIDFREGWQWGSDDINATVDLTAR